VGFAVGCGERQLQGLKPQNVGCHFVGAEAPTPYLGSSSLLLPRDFGCVRLVWERIQVTQAVKPLYF
jgi:hypothetical protein